MFFLAEITKVIPIAIGTKNKLNFG